MIENILIVDTETTGLSPKVSKVIEVGAVLFNLKHAAILQAYSTLLPCETNPVEHINHISAVASNCDYPRNVGDDVLRAMNRHAQACVAHNAEFDKKFIETLPCGSDLLANRWICTKKDFKWPGNPTRLRLEDICGTLGVPYLHAHRALIDCFLLAWCFQKLDYLENIFNNLVVWKEPDLIESCII